MTKQSSPILDISNLTLEQQVAQLFMVGYEGAAPNAITRRFLELGVGGLIFFRDNFDKLEPLTSLAVHQLLSDLDHAVPGHLPRPLMGIDQEGGQVERLPHTVFPTALTPRAVALSSNPEALAGDMYGMMASHLRALGFNLDFFPTLDVNLNRKNPIIGVRSFADNAETVWKLGRIAMEKFEDAGLIAVGKHFPGHGNGTVDSHLDLPTLHFTEEELKPFQKAVQSGLPAMLVAHGYYPDLQMTEEERNLPSSASPAIIQGLLRARCGFEGVIITDDMCMGAITKHRSPVEAALASLKAGVDILLYKQSTEDEWAVYEAVLETFKTGKLPTSQLHASVSRILALKSRYLQNIPVFNASDFTPEVCQRKADALALRGISIQSGDPALLPLKPENSLLLIHPDRQKLGNYAFDVSTSENLEAVFRASGFGYLISGCYPANADFIADDILGHISSTPKAICFVTFNPWKQAEQVDLYQLLRESFPSTPVIVVSAGTPYDGDVLPKPDLHLALCSYRPASMRALAHVLKTGPVVTSGTINPIFAEK